MSGKRIKFDIRQARKPIIVVLATWALVILGFWIFATRPAVREYGELHVGTEPQQAALRELRSEVERREQFLDALQAAQSDLKHLREEVLATRHERMIDVQLELKSVADRFSIDLAQITFDNEELHNEELDRFVMTVPLEGSYASLRRFLEAIEGSDKFILVEQVALGEGKQGGVQLELRITLATYFGMADKPIRVPREPVGRQG